MKIFIVHAHHEPKSFNGALTHVAQQFLKEQGHQVELSDLYQMNFNPVSDRRNFTTQKDPDYLKQQAEEMYASEHQGFAEDVQKEIEKLFWCDVLIMQFPLWWFGLPAILKGWVDRVLAMGILYGGGKWYDNGVLKGRRAMVSLTTGGPPTMYTQTGINGDVEQILFPIHHGILHFVGFEVLPPFIAWAVSRASQEERLAYLEQYRHRLGSLETTSSLKYPSLAEYDPKTFELKQ
ncbi:NAD(P)H-dependent oxidoreductase [Crocosphaera sp. Alani8]|uniref:NAD(P)H-dependent oxidoreductase n=1 Tax=Crocosphaera sp. Alani8 TaxID=3038952 RepID=UPI00313D966B